MSAKAHISAPPRLSFRELDAVLSQILSKPLAGHDRARHLLCFYVAAFLIFDSDPALRESADFKELQDSYCIAVKTLHRRCSSDDLDEADKVYRERQFDGALGETIERYYNQLLAARGGDAVDVDAFEKNTPPIDGERTVEMVAAFVDLGATRAGRNSLVTHSWSADDLKYLGELEPALRECVERTPEGGELVQNVVMTLLNRADKLGPFGRTVTQLMRVTAELDKKPRQRKRALELTDTSWKVICLLEGIPHTTQPPKTVGELIDVIAESDKSAAGTFRRLIHGKRPKTKQPAFI